MKTRNKRAVPLTRAEVALSHKLNVLRTMRKLKLIKARSHKAQWC
jgi:hypothetical protein